MRRSIFVLAVIALLTVSALPAMASTGGYDSWGNNQQNGSGDGVTVVDVSGQNSFGQYPYYDDGYYNPYPYYDSGYYNQYPSSGGVTVVDVSGQNS